MTVENIMVNSNVVSHKGKNQSKLEIVLEINPELDTVSAIEIFETLLDFGKHEGHNVKAYIEYVVENQPKVTQKRENGLLEPHMRHH